jgi:hypothetical protein
LINNRQGGRRRGRGGSGSGRQQSGAPGPGNRQDNRQRGNAAQLLEKYKSMARDAQMGGDRVQTEYFLQFADHYYRVLNENRARFEEQAPPRRGRDDFGYDEDEGDEESLAADGNDEEGDRDERDERPYREEAGDRYGRDDRPERQSRDDRGARPERQPRDDRGVRPERQPRDDRGERQERQFRDDRPDRQPREERAERPQPREFRNGGEAAPRRGRPRRDRIEGGAEEGEERISLDVLPPAIAPLAATDADGGDEPAKAPRRRRARPRDEGDEIAPAA